MTYLITGAAGFIGFHLAKYWLQQSHPVVGLDNVNDYYDIKLKEPLETQTTGGAMFPTTTIVTKNRIYVPIPKALEAAFRITDGAKEFLVRFDTIP